MLFSFLYQEYHLPTQEIAAYSDSYVVFILVLGISGSHTRDSNIFRQLCCFHSCIRNIRQPHKRQQHIQTAMLFSFLYQEYQVPTQEIATYSGSYVVFILVLGISGIHTRDSNIFRQLCCFHSCNRNITYPHKRQQHIQTAMLFSFLYQEYQVSTQEIATYSGSYIVFILVLGISGSHTRDSNIFRQLCCFHSCIRNIRYPHKRQQHIQTAMLFSFLYQEYQVSTQEIATYSGSYVVFILVIGISLTHTRDSSIFRQLCCFHSCIRNIRYPHKRQQHIQTAMLFSFLYQEYHLPTQEIATYSDSYVVFILVLGISGIHTRDSNIFRQLCCFHSCNRNIRQPHKRQQHIQTAMLFSFLYQEYQVSTQEIAAYSDSYVIFILVLGISGIHTRDSNIFRQLCCFHSCNRNITYPHKRQQHIQTAMLFSFLYQEYQVATQEIATYSDSYIV